MSGVELVSTHRGGTTTTVHGHRGAPVPPVPAGTRQRAASMTRGRAPRRIFHVTVTSPDGTILDNFHTTTRGLVERALVDHTAVAGTVVTVVQRAVTNAEYLTARATEVNAIRPARHQPAGDRPSERYQRC